MFACLIFLSMLFFSVNGAFAKESREYRSEHHFVLIGEPVSFTPYPGGGVRAAFRATDQLTFETAYTSSKSNLAGKSRIIASQVDALVRFYFGNSFNLSTGLGYRQTHFNFEYDGWSDRDEYKGVTARTGTTGVRFSIGNHWQHSRFVIGVDWIGFYAPVSKVAEEVVGDEDLSVNERTKVDDDMSEETDAVAPSLLRLHIGVAI